MTGGTDTGLVLALLSTTAYNSGLIVEKQALARLPALNGRRVLALAGSLVTSPRWLAGFALMLCGLGLQVLALMFAPVTVVQPVIASGVAIVLVLSRIVLHERLGRGEYACVGVMAVSVILLALSADGAAAVGFAVSGARMAAVAIPTCLAALAAAASASGSGPRKHARPATGVSYGVAALAIKALSGALRHAHGAGAVSAVVASPYLYVMAACSAAGLLLFQTALQRCRISIVAPVSNVLGSIYFMVAGTWLFHERLPADPARLALRLAGILIAGVVVVLLSRQAAAPEPAQERSALEESRAYLA